MPEKTNEPRSGGAPVPSQGEGGGGDSSTLWVAQPPVPPEAERAKMVGWYDPGVLIQTGLEVAVSTVLGRHADARLREGLGKGEELPFDYSQHVDGLWLDYTSDVGDGWNSTYAVAYHLAQPTLKLGDAETQRGRILIFGGDEVYPTASRPEYQRRTLAPYQTALPETAEPHPHLFAIPGNHDWYDSLVAFTRFFTARKWFGGWQPTQRRSYFALKLPHGWWLLGTDVQLGSDIDAEQVEFFKRVAGQMAEDDRVILCNAEPYWIHEQRYSELDPIYTEHNLKFLEHRVLKGRKIAVFIAGDLHHYRRHEDAEGRQKITAGGGGAFLHATHGADVSELAVDGFKHATSYPPPEESRKLAWNNLGFRKLNPSFSLLTAVVYVLIAWMLRPEAGPVAHPLELFGAVLRKATTQPGAGLTLLSVFLLFWLTTDTHSKSYKWKAGGLHALAHLSVLFFASWSASVLSATQLAPLVASLGGGAQASGGWFEFGTVSQMLVSGLGVALAGWFVAPLVMGLYLLVSLNRFGRHSNEAFSSLRIEDWKHFLRLHIDSQGDLTLYPVGVRRVPRRWKARESEQTPSLLVPADPEATPPELIEPPIRVKRARRP